jgi:hypothetical protein
MMIATYVSTSRTTRNQRGEGSERGRDERRDERDQEAVPEGVHHEGVLDHAAIPAGRDAPQLAGPLAGVEAEDHHQDDGQVQEQEHEARLDPQQAIHPAAGPIDRGTGPARPDRGAHTSETSRW